jgi:carbon monoxide dehydrogenase subunit G
MRISGSGAVRAPAVTVWAALADRDMLLRAYTGIDRLDVTANGECEFTVTIPIAAVSGTDSGEAVVTHAKAPSRLVARVSAAGARGTVNACLTVRLGSGSAGETELSYEADAEVAGPIAGIGQRLLISIARRLAGDFIAGLDRVLVVRPAAERSVERPAERSVERPAGRPIERLAERPAGRLAEPLRRPPDRRDQPGSAVRTGLVVGTAAGLAGMLVGAVLGRRSRVQAASAVHSTRRRR